MYCRVLSTEDAWFTIFVLHMIGLPSEYDAKFAERGPCRGETKVKETRKLISRNLPSLL